MVKSYKNKVPEKEKKMLVCHKYGKKSPGHQLMKAHLNKTFSVETAINGLKPEPAFSSIGRCITLQDLEDTNTADVMFSLAVPQPFITI